MTTADPFACFGGDSDDDDDDSDVIDDGSQQLDDGTNITSSSTVADADATSGHLANLDRARHLMDEYNTNKYSIASKATYSSNDAEHNDRSAPCTFKSSYKDQQTRTSTLPWPTKPPLYLGPMALSSSLTEEGGGRGYFATQDLPPGTCVLIEQPLIKGWSKEQMGKRLGLESIQYILEKGDVNDIVRCMEELHPRKEHVDAVYQHVDNKDDGGSSVSALDEVQIVDMMSEMNNNASHVEQVKALVAYTKEHNIANSDESPIAEHDINRLLLTLRYNGFDSGLYLHFAMFNHNEDPNCIKFRPADDESSAATQQQNDQLIYSEARTTRFVRNGEALILHYLENPREVSHATRRKILWDQHRFDIGDEHAYKKFLDSSMMKTGHLYNDNERGNHIFESELVHGKFPPSSREESDDNGAGDDDDLPTASNIEKALEDLEHMLFEIQEMFKGQSDIDVNYASDGAFDRAAALELTIGELITASQSTLGNTQHILLSRCRRLHLDALELLLSNCSSILTKKQSVELLARFLPSAQQLLHSMKRRLGNDHPDVARTYQDCFMGIQALLSSSPKRLLSLKLDDMNTLDQCSKMEHYCRMEKSRIENMYPKDVDEILRSVNKR